MRDKALDEQIEKPATRMLAWPPRDVTPLCAAEGCGAAALETGFCAKDETAHVQFFADELASLQAAALAPLVWFQTVCGCRISTDQAWALKMAVLAELTARRNPLVLLSQMPADEAARMCAGRDGGAIAAVLPDVPHEGVKDGPENREKRAALMGSLPRVHLGVTPVPAPAPASGDFRLRFALCCVAALAVLALIVHR
jgi:hypothetical protein